MNINTFFKFSKKQLVIVAFLITLLTAVRSGQWSMGYGTVGTGLGFPFLFWRTVTGTDVWGYIGESDEQLGIILSALSLVGDIIFWFMILFGIQITLKKILRRHIR